MGMNIWYKSIDKTPLVVYFNPVGGGLMLAVDRGIPCEGHTQVFSAHCTNTPDEKFVEQVIDESADELASQWDKFANLMHSMGNSLDTKEAIAAVFCTWLIGEIANKAEKLEDNANWYHNHYEGKAP